MPDRLLPAAAPTLHPCARQGPSLQRESAARTDDILAATFRSTWILSLTGTSPRADLFARIGLWCLVAVVFVNAVGHVLAICQPLIASDNWTHIHPFLRDAIAGHLDVGNFLVQRAGVDHAQPLNKLVMWLNYRYFDLDFVFEGLLAMAFGLASLLVLHRIVRADDGRGGTAREAPPLQVHLAFAAIAAVYFSLNSSFIYMYSMVTMWYSLYLFAFLMLLAAWHALVGGSLLPLALATLVLGVVGDDSALLHGTALSLALLLYGVRNDDRRRAWQAIAVVAACVLATRVLYWTLGETSGATQPMFNQPLVDRVRGLAAQWGDAWAWFAVPASSGILGEESLAGLAGSGAGALRNALAVLLLVAHGAFWWAAMRLRTSATWLAAVSLMLMFYAHVGAVLLARVFVMGTTYLDQPRYVSFYQLGIIALLLMGMAWAVQRRHGAGRHVVAVAAAVLVLVQVPITREAKAREPYIDGHNRQMARDMAQVARDPANPPAKCEWGVDLCTLPLERRIELVNLLRENRLSLFSPDYPRRHPGDAAAAQSAQQAP